MKIWALPLCLVLAGCRGDRVASHPGVLAKVEALRAAKDPAAALQLIDGSLPIKGANDETGVRLRIAKAQILRERNGAAGALEFIGSAPQAESPFGSYLIRREQASLESELGRFADEDRHLKEATEFARQAGKAKYVAGTEINRSFALVKLKRLDEAQQCLTDAKRYGESSGDHSWDPYISKSAGRILLSSNRFEAAVGPLQAAYDQFLKEKKPQRAAEVTIDLGWAYYRLGRLEKAQQLYEECERGVPLADKHVCLGHLGNIFHDLGQLKKAAAYYKQAADLAKNQSKDYYSGWLVNLAMTLADERQWAEAAFYNSEALAIAKSVKGSIGLSHAMVNAGRIEAGRHDYKAAELDLLQVESERDNPAAVLDAYAALAQIYADTNRPALAKRQFETAVKLVDDTRTDLREDEDKLFYLASLMKLHKQYVAFLMSRSDVAGALQASETSRARLLRDRVHLKGAASISHEIADYQQAARSGSVAYLVYWVAPERSFVWAIDGARFQSFPLPGENRIRTLVEQHQRTLEHSSNGQAPPLNVAADLFDMVVKPALKALPKAKRFVIVPDGPLYGINFETLKNGSSYWIEDATVAVAPSLELLLGQSAARQGAPTALLIGDALEWTPEFPPLFNAAKEIAHIGEKFPKNSATRLAGAQATREEFTKADPAKFSYIHFAAHAFPNPNSPLDSAIILSQGRLSVKDVLATPVNAQLVTISACSSAGARTYSGEGLVGLAWAFLRSGAHGVVAGLWDVNDHSSPVLMEALYSGLLAGAPPADALRAAKLNLLAPGSKFTDPYYWGAFQLYLGAR